MLQEEISNAQRLVRTDAYQMSIGEIVSMYEQGEIVIHPDFQRLFRWTLDQKSRLIESILLGIPLPPIFVFEREDGNWELIDGLQRISTLLEFMGILNDPYENKCTPSILEATKYLPSLNNVVWEKSNLIAYANLDEQNELPKDLKLAIRRSRLGVEILKRPSDSTTKYDLFQRLNAGGTQANPQELRNCIMIMVNPDCFRRIKISAENDNFLSVCNIQEEQRERQKHMEFATRCAVMIGTKYDGKLDVEAYIDSGVVDVFSRPDFDELISKMDRTFTLLARSYGSDALKRIENGRHSGKVGLVGLEGIAVAIGRNIDAIEALPNPIEFIKIKINEFWNDEETSTFASPGMRGTTRLQRTLPFGEAIFHP